jgi:hypothetical protein
MRRRRQVGGRWTAGTGLSSSLSETPEIKYALIYIEDLKDFITGNN